MTQRITLLGVPWDEKSSFQRGAAGGPAAIRAAFNSESTNTWNEAVADVATILEDAGDLPLNGAPDAVARIEQAASSLLARRARPIFLGGDHAVTVPLVRGVHRVVGPVTVLHLDAHPDLYPEFGGDRYSHACPMVRILEEGLATLVVQCGIRTMTGEQEAEATRFGVQVLTMRGGPGSMREAIGGLAGPLYLSLDLDVLDPAFAPGVSHPEPGGLSTRELIGLIQAIPRGRLVAADIVELNPANDARDLTARVAAKLVKEIAGRITAGG